MFKTLKKSSSPLPYIFDKKLNAWCGHDVHVDFSQNWEIHGPWVGVQAQGQGKYGHVMKL